MRKPDWAAQPVSTNYRACLDICEWADDIGFQAVTFAEHHGADDHYLPSPITMAGLVGGRTRKMDLRMEEAGVPVVYGPGRHPQSGSIFFYFLDPDGLTIEYSQGMEEFPEDNPRPPRRFPLEGGVFDYWNGKPKPGFTAVGAIG